MHTGPLDPPTRLSSVIREGFPWFFLILHSECGQSVLQEPVWLSGSGPCPGEKGTLLDKGLLLLFLIKAKDPLARSECGCERHTSACLAQAHVCVCLGACVCSSNCAHIYCPCLCLCVCVPWVYMCASTPVGMYVSMCLAWVSLCMGRGQGQVCRACVNAPGPAPDLAVWDLPLPLA